MDKRSFIKFLSAIVAGPIVSPLLAKLPDTKLTNWAGNLEYSTQNLYSANSLEQVRQFVKKQNKFKVLGTRHCFNKIADSANQFLSYKAPDEVMSLDPRAHTVTVAAGITYGQLSPYLHSKGFALHNLASLPHISVAGSCSTATHGSGDKNGNLATAVSALEFVTANGDLLKLSRQNDGEKFTGEFE
jgi:xylitol oxidase